MQSENDKQKKNRTLPRINSYSSQILLQLLADTIAIWLGFMLQLYIRFFSGTIETTTLPTFSDYTMGAFFMSMFWYIIFFIAGMYQNWHLRSPFDEFFALAKASFFGCFVIVLLFITDDTNSFRMMFLLYFIIMTSLFAIFRAIARYVQVFLRKKQIITIPTIIVGDISAAIDFYLKVQENIAWGIDIKGLVFINSEPDTEEQIDKLFAKKNINMSLCCGNVNNFSSIIDSKSVENVVFSAIKPDTEHLLNIAAVCEQKDIRIKIEPNLYDYFTGQSRTQNIYGIPLIEVDMCLQKPWEAFIKRVFDIVFSCVVLLLGLPVWLLIAIIIKLDSEGNIFYSQIRIGKNNKPFTIYKFRSMKQNKCKDPLTASWTKVGDPRVTKFGRIIRKMHLDEIPQFVNVLIGDMSVVGPRPEQIEFVEKFTRELSYYSRRHLVRPGITGWWQVKYKPFVLDMDELKSRTKDDFYYIEHMSIRFDFEILVRTVWCVLRGQGQA